MMRILLVFTLLLILPAAYGADRGTVIKADDLKAKPFRDAKTIATVAVGDRVDILKRDGGWLRVKSAKGSGWVRMLSIRRGAARKTTVAKVASDLAELAAGRAGTGRIVASTGVRGLNEEDLKAARYDEAELKLMESFLTGRPNARKFAATGKLAARKMDYLPDSSMPGTGTGEAK